MKHFNRYSLNSSHRVIKLDTNKAYALRWRSQVIFIPIEYCKMVDFEDGCNRWIVEIPTWLEERNEDLRSLLELIEIENEGRN